eukprot:TRINITY_DN73529_c0_g1_i1.p1 TRINITY_DN73529_c0_g1~~TRINITY_DN73529_c0_g1_i1.p1  ORF type:complete len:213 (+),score=115.30 TRINITY_DN73529_c0_g1_i1:172-810(+)
MAFFGNLFGKKKTPEEMMREYKRGIDRTIRELERERVKMQNNEKKLIAELRKMAKTNQTEAMRVMAKDLVRTRAYCTKFYKMKAQMQAVSLKLQTLSSTAQMAEAMKGVTRSMRAMNKSMNLQEMQKIMMEFQKQNEMMGMKEEAMNDAIDDVMDDEGDEEEETEGMIAQVLDEIGLDFQSQVGTSKQKIGDDKIEEEDDDLQARLDKLRKN